jgi:hypothetical protein
VYAVPLQRNMQAAQTHWWDVSHADPDDCHVTTDAGVCRRASKGVNLTTMPLTRKCC